MTVVCEAKLISASEGGIAVLNYDDDSKVSEKNGQNGRTGWAKVDYRAVDVSESERNQFKSEYKAKNPNSYTFIRRA